jgi:hypothetical protein
MTEDITVNLLGGWYMISETVTMDAGCSGTGGYSVIFQAAPGEAPVISGGREITGWTQHDAGDNIWRVSVPGLETRQIYINCVRAIRAHSHEGLPGANRTGEGYTTSDNTMQNWGNKGDIEFVFNAEEGGTGGDGSAGWASEWTERRVGIASISGTSIIMDEPAWSSATGGSGPQDISYPTDIENAYELLDEPGEWYLDRSTDVVYYIPRPGENMTSAQVIAGEFDGTLVSLEGTLDSPISNIQFKGITFAHTTWLRPNTNDGFPEGQANYVFGTGFPPMAVLVETGRSVRFERCIFKHLGAMGLQLSGGSQDCVVEGCVFTDISGNCILLGSVNDPDRNDTRARDSRNQIMNTYIHDSPCEYRGGCGVFAGYVSDFLVTRNEIANTPYTGVSCGWGWGRDSYARNNEFSYNAFHDVCQSLGDGGPIYTLSAQPNSTSHHNWFDGMPYRNSGAAVYPDEGSAYFEIHHNVCSNITNKWLHIWTNSIHDIDIHDIWSNTANELNNGVNCPVTNLTIVEDGNWPQEAQEIMDGAGIESDWADVKTLRCACSILNPASVVLPFKYPAGDGLKTMQLIRSGKMRTYNLKGQIIHFNPVYGLNKPMPLIMLPKEF